MTNDNLRNGRKKLLNPALGSLTDDEIVALLNASGGVPEPRTHGAVTLATAHEILDIANEYPRDKAADVIATLLAERSSPVIEKTWGDEASFRAID